MNNIDKFFTADIEKFSSSYFDYLKVILDRVSLAELRSFSASILDARERGSMIFFIGNGGSAATASHFANDLAFGTRENDKPFKVMSIVDNLAVLTALGNDYGYEEIFVRQLQVYAQKGDMLVGISASGNSPNIIRSFEYAKSAGIKTIALTAFDGGKMKEISDQGVHVPTEVNEYGPAEDVHMVIDHLLVSYLMRIVNR